MACMNGDATGRDGGRAAATKAAVRRGRAGSGVREVPAAFLAARAHAGVGHFGAAAHEATAPTWVYRHVSAAIVEGLLWPGLRLPSARELSRSWGVARGAVDEALMRLAREGLVERRVGRGSFVARRLPPGIVRELDGREALAHPAGEALRALAPLLRIARNPAAVAEAVRQGSARPLLDPRLPDIEHFPLVAWRRCMAAAHAEADRASLCYGPPAGWPPLREATARYLALTRGIECAAEQVLILNGPLQALDLLVRVLIEPGDTLVVERPGYMSVARTVGLPPLDLCGAPVDDDGLDVAAARRLRPAPAMVLLQPLNQYPTGARLSQARRDALLDWAHACRAWVVEGDHLGEVLHDGAAPPTLMQFRGGARHAPRDGAAPAEPTAAAGHGQVMFLGTFNGIVFPGLRLSYLVVPRRLVPAFTAVRGLFGDHPPLAPQQALARFIDEGHLGTHLRRMRTLYRRRRDAAREAARRHLPPEVRLGPLWGGTHGCLHLPEGCADEPLAQRLVAAGLGIELLSTYSWPERGSCGIVFGYGADDEERIDAGMRLLGRELGSWLAGGANEAAHSCLLPARPGPLVAAQRG